MFTQKSSLIKNIFWISTLAAVLIFYVAVNNSINTLLERNKVLEDSLNVLQKELLVLDSLLNAAPADASFNDTIMSQTENSVTVKFIPYFVTAKQYKWDFGDGSSSIDTAALHKYKVTKTKEFKVTLTINYNGQNYSKSKIIKLQSINDTTKIDASFDTVTVSRGQNSVTMKFSPRTRNAGSYDWDFGISRKSNLKEPLQTFDLNGSLIYTIKLKIINNGISAESSKKLIFKKVSAVKISIRLEKDNFLRCDSTQHKFTLNPVGGTVTGPGVIKSRDEYYFIPSQVKVKGNKIKFKYIIFPDTVTNSVIINNIDASFTIRKDTSAENMQIVFNCVPKVRNYDSYSWVVNNEKVSNEQIYQLPPDGIDYSMISRHRIVIRLTVINDGCTAFSEQKFSY